MRPYIICHMMASLDGRIDCEMTEQIDDTNHYYEALAQLGCPSTLEGKTTLAMHYAQDGVFQQQRPHEDAGRQFYKAVERRRADIGSSGKATGWQQNVGNAEDRTSERRAMLASALPGEEEFDDVKRRTSERRAMLASALPSEEEFDEVNGRLQEGKAITEGYAVGVDTRGTLLWDDNTTELFGRPLLMILSEQASQEYLDYLKSKHISYITTGYNGIDLPSAMETLRTVFGVERLAVVGGGSINGSMLDLGLIDEVSMMYGYGIDGRKGMAAAFDGRPMECKPVRLTFKSMEEQDGIVWIRYQVNNK